jgi:hypothetical protein
VRTWNVWNNEKEMCGHGEQRCGPVGRRKGTQVYFWFVNEMMNLLYYLYMRLVTVADGWMALPLQFKVSTR